ncbi:hypothetical protein FX016_23240 [Cupriavidus gilardii]|nr:hypothetical protein FX016_23240 [Cupriavidus gilardii]
MKKFMTLMAALVPLVVAAQDETVLQYSGTTRGYASPKPDGGLSVEQAWEGHKVVKRADGNCYRIERRNLRIEPIGNGQRPVFDENVTMVSCNSNVRR